MSDGYRINTLMTLFNLFDTLGRNFPKLYQIKEKGLILISFFRLIFMFTFPFLIILETRNWSGSTFSSIYAVVNMMLFSFTSGYATSTAFSLAPDSVEESLKGKSGSCLSFMLIVGIFSGTLFSGIMQMII